MLARQQERAVGRRLCESGIRGNREGGFRMRSGLAVLCQHAGGCAMLVCSEPWVTAKSRAASREAKALSKRNTRLQLPVPWDRWTENEARKKRPQSVGCVEGETTYLPMEMAVCEIGCNQGRRLVKRPARASRDAVGCSSTDPLGDKGRKWRPAWGGLPPISRRCGDDPVGRRDCNKVNYIAIRM